MGSLFESLGVAEGRAEVRPEGRIFELDQGPFTGRQLGEIVRLLIDRRGWFGRLRAAGAGGENDGGEDGSHEAAG